MAKLSFGMCKRKMENVLRIALKGYTELSIAKCKMSVGRGLDVMPALAGVNKSMIQTLSICIISWIWLPKLSTETIKNFSQ